MSCIIVSLAISGRNLSSWLTSSIHYSLTVSKRSNNERGCKRCANSESVQIHLESTSGLLYALAIKYWKKSVKEFNRFYCVQFQIRAAKNMIALNGWLIWRLKKAETWNYGEYRYGSSNHSQSAQLYRKCLLPKQTELFICCYFPVFSSTSTVATQSTKKITIFSLLSQKGFHSLRSHYFNRSMLKRNIYTEMVA